MSISSARPAGRPLPDDEMDAIGLDHRPEPHEVHLVVRPAKAGGPAIRGAGCGYADGAPVGSGTGAPSGRRAQRAPWVPLSL